MPNHVHTMIEIEAGISLGRIVGSWKRHTASRIKETLGDECPESMKGRGASVWQDEYWDRYIRDEKHLANSMDYIESNPVKAGLVGSAELWRWSSGRLRG
jgi:REP element-mobilizing transposase RayT